MTNAADLKARFRDQAFRRPELSLHEILGDSLTRDLMQADHVDPVQLAADLLRVASDLAPAANEPAPPCTAGC